MSSEDRPPCALERDPLCDPLILRMLGLILQSETHVQRQRVPHAEMIGLIRDRYVKVFVDQTTSEHFIASWLLDVFGYHYCLKCQQKISLQLEWGSLTGSIDCRISTAMPACAVSLGSEWCKSLAKDVSQDELDDDVDTLEAHEHLFSSRQPSVESIDLMVEEPPRDAPTVSNEDVTASSAAAALGKNEQEAFSSPIKKRKLSPPKKAPERYLEDAPQRRNSVQKKETAEMRTLDESSLNTSKSPAEPEAAKIVKRSSGSQAGGKKNSEKLSEYTPGQLVYAKVKGYPFWPARVNGIASSTKPVKYNIFFYGTHERAKLTAKDLVPVNAETKEKYGKPNKRSLFSEGLVEMQRNQWVDYPGSFVSSQPSQPISSTAGSTTNAAAAATATTTSSTAPTRQTGVESSPTKPAGIAIQQEPQLPPVTLVPQLNVQQTSPHSPQGSSQKTGSDKEDSDSFSDSSDST